MALHTLQAAAAEDKPLPSLPSPTLTNPDMVLPDFLPDDAVRVPTSTGRPPSPSYLIAQHGQKVYAGTGRTIEQNSRKIITRKRTFHQRPRVSSRRSATDDNLASPMLYPEAALGSSPTVNMAAGPTPQNSKMAQDGWRISTGASSINSDDWEAMQIPDFAGLDSDTETLGDDLDVGTPPSETYAEDYVDKRVASEQSSVTLMRAELILANAKKRLNLMDQNLRDAREKVAPLTAANLRRATSLNTALAQPSLYSRARQTTRDNGDPYDDQQISSSPPGEGLGHSRVLSDPAPSPYTPFIRTPSSGNIRSGPPVSKFTPSWTPNTLRGSRSSEILQSGRTTPRLLHRTSPEPQLKALAEEEASVKADTPDTRNSPSATQDLREQLQTLKGRISDLKERAREDSLRRRSLQTLRAATPLTDSDAPSHKKSEGPGHIRRVSSSAGVVRPPDPDIPSPSSAVFVGIPRDEEDSSDTTPTKERAFVDPWLSEQDQQESSAGDTEQLDNQTDSATAQLSRWSVDSVPNDKDDVFPNNDGETTDDESIYEDAPATQQRHEDREDAFDYGNFFLHSAMGTFSRPRGSSVSSTDSNVTARGPSRFDEVPSTPETPETLRKIETQRGLHKRAMSSESVASIATFETAKEGRFTPSLPISDWLAPTRSKSRSEGNHERTDSRATFGSCPRSPIRSPTRAPTAASQRDTFVAIPPSQSAQAVAALLNPQLGQLELMDNALVFTLVESLRQVCEKLQLGDDAETSGRLLRRRLDDARRALDGTQVDV